ncbi:MAG: GGDEF domain-containing protein, partial [Candidatus Omnitrophica bacterium]|nr:GGDEF domain-containing protein [Candidatus Omnitrophota bacterium]
YILTIMKIAAMRYTLRQRIITLLIIFSIIFISAFCGVQVKNQLSTITAFNAYRARLSAYIVKNNLEKIVREDAEPAAEREQTEPPASTGSPDIVPLLQQTILSLKQAKIMENAVIFNNKREVVTSSGTALKDMKLNPSDYRIVEECLGAAEKEKWFIPNIDAKRRIIDIYIPIYDNGNPEYVAKAIFSLGNIEDALKQVYLPIIITIVIVVLVNIVLGSILTKTIVKPINILNDATKAIAGGNLKLKVSIKTKDEIEELGNTFNYMTDSLQKMKDRAENANPLTKLPGNNVIHEEISKRINASRKFVVVYSDLDNFKAFNDKYGIAAGDKAIKMTADVMRDSLKKAGGPDDFLGHEGGDDFVLLTTPNKADQITKFICDEFDRRVRDLYKKEDLDTGFIIAHARDGSIQKFPIMTISLAGVSNERRTLSSYGEITNICAEIKKKAKAIPQSVFVLDKREDKPAA